MDRERQIRDLRALLEVSQAMSGERSLENLLQLIIQKAEEVLEADRCSLFLYDESRNELWSKFATQLGDLRMIRFPVGTGIAGEVARTGKVSNVRDAYADPRFNPEFDQKTGYQTRSILCAPMISSDQELIGVIEILNKKSGGAFDNQDEALLGALASHAAVALDRARLVEAYLEKQRMEVRLRLAREIQMSLLPKRLPPFPFSHQLDLHAAIEPAKEVGGDFYDFFLIDDHHLFFAIGDVSGKGVPAALFMAVAKTLLKTSARKGFGPGHILSEVNTELCLNNDSCTLVTIFCGILNTKTGEVLYASAGHNPPLLVRPGNQVQYVNDGAGLVIGVEALVTYDAQRVTLEPGDFLFLYTDGVTEARNERRELFSEGRLKDEVCASKKHSSQHLIEEIMHTIRVFSQGMPQADDITMMNLRLKSGFSPRGEPTTNAQ